MRRLFTITIFLLILIFSLSACVEFGSSLGQINLTNFSCLGSDCDEIDVSTCDDESCLDYVCEGILCPDGSSGGYSSSGSTGNSTVDNTTTLGNNTTIDNITTAGNATATTVTPSPTPTSSNSGSAARSFRRSVTRDSATEVADNLAVGETEITTVAQPASNDGTSNTFTRPKTPVKAATKTIVEDVVLDDAKAFYQTGFFWIWFIVLLIALISGIVFFVLHKYHS